MAETDTYFDDLVASMQIDDPQQEARWRQIAPYLIKNRTSQEEQTFKEIYAIATGEITPDQWHNNKTLQMRTQQMVGVFDATPPSKGKHAFTAARDALTTELVKTLASIREPIQKQYPKNKQSAERIKEIGLQAPAIVGLLTSMVEHYIETSVENSYAEYVKRSQLTIPKEIYMSIQSHCAKDTIYKVGLDKDGGVKLRGYISTAITNNIRDIARNRRYYLTDSLDTMRETYGFDYPDSDTGRLTSTDMGNIDILKRAETIIRSFSRSPESDWKIFSDRFVDGLEYQQIADENNISMQQVKTRLFAIKAKLKQDPVFQALHLDNGADIALDAGAAHQAPRDGDNGKSWQATVQPTRQSPGSRSKR